MKILHVVPGIGSVYGGPSLSVLSLVRHQVQQGIDVDVVTTNRNGAQLLDVPVETWLADKYGRIQYFSCWYLQDYKISPSMSQWLHHHVRDYDVVNTHGIFSYANRSAYQACQRDRVPYIIHPHGMLEKWAMDYKSWKKRPYYHLIEKPALERASAIRVLAKSEAESLAKLGIKTPLVSIPNGISVTDELTTTKPSLWAETFPETVGKTQILFLGRIDPKKGLDLLATAFAKIHAQFPDTHLVVAGPDNIGYLPTVQQYFATAQCLEHVTFTGMLEGELKAAALAAATIYVAPSYSEGFSMSVLEAMSFALPCVITTGCNFPEAAEAHAAHVVDIDANAISDALIQCLKEPAVAQSMGRYARRFVLTNYTWTKIATDFINCYQSILSDRQESHPLN
jgi:glycosyltransferase involved in cell wall biosynthesis